MREITGVLSGILILLMMSSCFKKEDYDLIKAEDLIKDIKIDSTSLSADGRSSTSVHVLISSAAIPSRRRVVLRTDLGFFLNGKGDSIVLNADNDFKAEAALVSSQTGNATIKASIVGYNYTSPVGVVFTKSYPGKITVSVDSFSVSNSYKSEVLITASMSGVTGGIPSKGHEVTFSVLSPLGTPMGAFLNGENSAFSDVTGKASIRYTAGDSGITGKLTIMAQTNKSDGSVISNVTYIYLTP